MKKILATLVFFLLFIKSIGQTYVLSTDVDFRNDTLRDTSSVEKSMLTAACGTPFLSTGYPAWTNYWAGWMVRIINTNACPIVINSFEARFQGTSGYRIYTKTGTFIGFETNAAAWTLVGSLASLTGTSTTAPTTIPIAVNVTIPVGGSQSFYLTRSDNLVANRHLYIPGTGTAGTTIYASNADLSITEGEYVDPYFAALQVGVRRPSFDVCYTISCPLPIELLSFKGINKGTHNLLTWETATELNNDYFIVERSSNAVDWEDVGIVDGSGNSVQTRSYSINDYNFVNGYNYYRLTQVDYNGQRETFNIIVVDNSAALSEVIKVTNIMGQEVDESFQGLRIIHYSDGTIIKKVGR